MAVVRPRSDGRCVRASVVKRPHRGNRVRSGAMVMAPVIPPEQGKRADQGHNKNADHDGVRALVTIHRVTIVAY